MYSAYILWVVVKCKCMWFLVYTYAKKDDEDDDDVHNIIDIPANYV